VSVAGQVFPFTLLPGTLDEPLVLTRDADDRLHCLSNVCTHRGTLVVEGAGHLQQLRCRYHGRRFTLDGRFHSMPEFEGTKNFPSKADDLPAVSVARLERFLMVALAPAMPFDDVAASVRARLAGLPFADLVYDATATRDYLVEANWALYVDNYLEGFHILYVHSSLATTLDYGAYAVELERYAVLQLGIAKPGERAFTLPAGHRDAQRSVAAYYFWLFPTTMFNVYPWGVSVNVVTPLAVDRTRVSFLPFVWDENARADGAGSGLDRGEREDEAIVGARPARRPLAALRPRPVLPHARGRRASLPSPPRGVHACLRSAPYVRSSTTSTRSSHCSTATASSMRRSPTSNLPARSSPNG